MAFQDDIQALFDKLGLPVWKQHRSDVLARWAAARDAWAQDVDIDDTIA